MISNEILVLQEKTDLAVNLCEQFSEEVQKISEIKKHIRWIVLYEIERRKNVETH